MRGIIMFVILGLVATAGCSQALAATVDDDDAENTRRLADLASYRAFVAAASIVPAPTEAEQLSAQCAEDEVAWVRASLATCAARCHSDEDCLGYETGDERCRVIATAQSSGDASPALFVDAETAAVLDEADALALESAYVEDFISVVPACDVSPCTPITVPAPRHAISVRVCDALWDLEELTVVDAADE